ncbi:putative mitochondrial protein like [Capsicum annuum]
MIFILVYVDDVIITGNNPSFLESIISKLGAEFAIRDLGPLSFFLGIQVTRHSIGIFLSQECYVSDILTRARMQACKLLPSPMSTSTKLHIGDSAFFHDPILYR